MKKRKKESLTLSDIIRGMQHCVNTSAEIAEQHYTHTFEKFFDSGGRLLTQPVKIGDTMQMDIPLLCMSNHNSLEFEEMHIKMQIHIQDMQQKQTETPFEYGTEKYQFTRSSLNVALGEVHKDNDETSPAEIEMIFKRSTPPEAVARLIDRLNNAIQIYTVNQESEESV